MKVLIVKRVDTVTSSIIDVNLEQICMVGDHHIGAVLSKKSCVITLANGQVCAIEISRAELKKKMECS